MRSTSAGLAALLIMAGMIFVAAPVFAADPYAEAGFFKVENAVDAPGFLLENLKGEQKKLSDFREKNVLLFFWTTW